MKAKKTVSEATTALAPSNLAETTESLAKIGKRALNLSPERKVRTEKPKQESNPSLKSPLDVWQKTSPETIDMTIGTAIEWSANKARYGTTLKLLAEKHKAAFQDYSYPLYVYYSSSMASTAQNGIENVMEHRDRDIKNMTSHLMSKTVEWAILSDPVTAKAALERKTKLEDKLLAYVDKVFNLNPDRTIDKNSEILKWSGKSK